jgi:hypothetical protein
LASEHKEGDCSVFVPFGEIPLQWYIYQHDPVSLNLLVPGSLPVKQSECERIWLISYHRVESPLVERTKQMLERDFFRVLEKHYFWVDLDLYIPPERR